LQASQCFTKYKFRDDAAAGSDDPGIVATQVRVLGAHQQDGHKPKRVDGL